MFNIFASLAELEGNLSTSKLIRLLEEHGVETPNGLVRAEAGLLKLPTVNRYLNQCMTPKDDPENPFQGIPGMLCMNNGPITR